MGNVTNTPDLMMVPAQFRETSEVDSELRLWSQIQQKYKPPKVRELSQNKTVHSKTKIHTRQTISQKPSISKKCNQSKSQIIDSKSSLILKDLESMYSIWNSQPSLRGNLPSDSSSMSEKHTFLMTQSWDTCQIEDKENQQNLSFMKVS